MKPTLVPAVLKPSFKDIADAAYSVADITDYIQIDIVDGVHAPGSTWPFSIHDVTRQEIGRLDNLPVSYELDLKNQTCLLYTSPSPRD